MNSTSLIWKEGKVAGLHPDFLKNFEDFLKEVKKRDLLAYPTFFAYPTDVLEQPMDPNLKTQWWNLMNNKYGGLDALKEALRPLFVLMNDTDYASNIFGIDLINEIDNSIIHNQFENQWYGANKFICELRNSIRDASPSPKVAIPVTASIGWPYIPFKSRGAENIILDPNPHPNCVDFWDIHIYDNEGDIANCQKINEVAKKYNKKIYLGEFGQFSKSYDDNLQLNSTKNFIKNAKNCGFSGALAWRLKDVRDGHNPEARFSFYSWGKTRPAYDYIMKFNETEQRNFETLASTKHSPTRKIATVQKKLKKKRVPKKTP